jgi:hypothetical protein
MEQKQLIQIFLEQKRDAFKTTLQQLAEYGVTIRSFTELQDHIVDVENALSITQQLMIHAYRNAILVSTVEALFKSAEAPDTDPSDPDALDPGPEQGQQRQPDRRAHET